jgi:hypothetical protein
MSENAQIDHEIELVSMVTVEDLKRVSESHAWLVKLLEAYETQTHLQIKALLVAIKEEKAASCTELTHNLKSSNLQMGAARLGKIFQEIEDFVVAGNIAAAKEKCDNLQTVYAQTVYTLRAALLG